MKLSKLPCPFCGENEARLDHGGGNVDVRRYHVQCEECHAMGPEAGSADGAVIAWNQVAPAPEGTTP